MSEDKYEWSDVAPMMVGNWENAILEINGLDLRNYKHTHHYPCPMCGGNDRFRYDNRKPKSRSPDGSGGFFCNNCGGGDGMKLLQGVTGMTFYEAVNALGRFVNAQPVEKRHAALVEIHSAPRMPYGKEDLERATDIMSKTYSADKCALTTFHGIAPASLRIIERYTDQRSNLMGDFDQWRVAVPVWRINQDGSAGELCNVALLGFEAPLTFVAGDISYNSAHIISGNDSIVICERWSDAWHVHHSTGATVYVAFSPSNVDHLAYIFGERVKAIAVQSGDVDTVIYAEALGLPVWGIVGKSVKFSAPAAAVLEKWGY